MWCVPYQRLDLMIPYTYRYSHQTTKFVFVGGGDDVGSIDPMIKRIDQCGDIKVSEGDSVQQCGGHQSMTRQKCFQVILQEIRSHREQ
jgi:hypothetical protein